VSIDIDGTLGDYHRHFLNFASAYMGLRKQDWIQPEEYNGVRGFKDWFLDRTEQPADVWYDIKLAYRQGAQKRSMPVRPWAAGLTRQVKALGAELWLCTTRPYLRLDGIDPDTRFWLAHHGIVYDHLLYDEHKYMELARRIDPERVCAILDDLPEDLIEAGNIFGRMVCILIRASHNVKAIDMDLPFEDVHEGISAYNKIKERVDGWFAAHEEHGTPVRS
jgi:hypothetical protein